jgi:uncharacterized protein involved in exopolysaccharide biosynthesis
MNERTRDAEISFKRIVFVIFRRKWIIIATVAAAVAGGLYARSTTGITYRATASILLMRQGPSNLLQFAHPYLTLDEELNTEVVVIRSTPVIEGAINTLREKRGQPPLSDAEVLTAVENFRSALTPIPVPESSIIRINMTSPDAERAKEAVQAVAESYVERRTVLGSTPGLDEYYHEEVTRLEMEIAELGKIYTALLSEGALSGSDQDGTVLMSRLTLLKEDYDELRLRAATAEAAAEQMRTAMFADTTLLVPNADLEDFHSLVYLYNELAKRQTELVAARSRYTSEHKDVIAGEEQVHSLRRAIREHSMNMIRTAEVTVEVLQGEEEAARQVYEDETDQLRERTKLMFDANTVGYKIHAMRETYENLLARYQDAKMNDVSDPRTGKARILDPGAVYPVQKPVQKPAFMVFLVLAAFFLGFGIAFTSEAADHSLKDRGDAEDYLGLPVLGSVPDSKEGLKNGDLLR